MRDLFLTVRDICLFRRGPQDLPHAPDLLIALLVLGMAFDVGVASLHADGLANMFSQSLVSTAFSAGVLYSLLQWRGKASRFTQTLLAQVACGLAFSLLLVPLLLGMGAPPATPEAVTPLQGMIGLLGFSLLLWLLVVNAHILRHALEVPLAAAFLIAALWMIAERILSTLLFGKAAGG